MTVAVRPTIDDDLATVAHTDGQSMRGPLVHGIMER
jgi:hypothetical protein